MSFVLVRLFARSLAHLYSHFVLHVLQKTTVHMHVVEYGLINSASLLPRKFIYGLSFWSVVVWLAKLLGLSSKYFSHLYYICVCVFVLVLGAFDACRHYCRDCFLVNHKRVDITLVSMSANICIQLYRRIIFYETCKKPQPKERPRFGRRFFSIYSMMSGDSVAYICVLKTKM